MTAYIIASAIPVFGGLVSLVGALLGTLMSLQPMGAMWIYDNWRKSKNQLMVLLGWLEHLHHCVWLLFDRRWNLRLHRWHHQQLQSLRGLRGLDLR